MIEVSDVTYGHASRSKKRLRQFILRETGYNRKVLRMCQLVEGEEEFFLLADSPA